MPAPFLLFALRLRKNNNRHNAIIMTTSGIATPTPAFAPVERPEEDEDDIVSVDVLPVVVDVGAGIVSLLVEAVAVAEAGVYDVAVTGSSRSS